VDIEGAARRLAEALESASLCAELRAYGAAPLTRDLLNAKPNGPSAPEKKPKK